MEVGEGSADRHRPFILTLGRHEMPDCACVRGFGGAWRLECEGRARSIPRSLGNKAPTHGTAVWQGWDRKLFSGTAGQDMAPALLPTVCQVSGPRGLSEPHCTPVRGRDRDRGVWGGGVCWDHPSACDRPTDREASGPNAACSTAAPRGSSPAPNWEALPAVLSQYFLLPFQGSYSLLCCVGG